MCVCTGKQDSRPTQTYSPGVPTYEGTEQGFTHVLTPPTSKESLTGNAHGGTEVRFQVCVCVCVGGWPQGDGGNVSSVLPLARMMGAPRLGVLGRTV